MYEPCQPQIGPFTQLQQCLDGVRQIILGAELPPRQAQEHLTFRQVVKHGDYMVKMYQGDQTQEYYMTYTEFTPEMLVMIIDVSTHSTNHRAIGGVLR